MARLQIRRYIWLIDIIRSAGERGITFKEIQKKWADAKEHINYDGSEYKLRAFRDHIHAIADEFEIDIVCDRRNNTYHIEGYDEVGSVKQTLVDALILNNALREMPDLRERIIFNDCFYQNAMPKVIRAIKEHTAIIFRYQRYNSFSRAMQAKKGVPPDVDRTVEFEPYGLYFNTVWFSVGRNVADGKIHIYTLHRMEDIDFSFQTYNIPEDFNVKQYMTDYWVDNDDSIEPHPGREPDDAFTLKRFEASGKWDF